VIRAAQSWRGAACEAEPAPGDAWKAIEPAGLELSQPKAKGLAGAMRNLRGAAVVPGPVPADAGLAKPTAVATFKVKSGPPVTLTIGAKKDAQWYVRSSRRPELFLMNDYLARRFFKKPDDLKPDSDKGKGAGG